MIITQDEYNVTKQTNRFLHIKIDLLNFNFQKVDELSGTVVGDPSFVINSESAIRRTCSFSIVPTDSSFDIKEGNKIWLDKYVKVYLGIENNRTNYITYTNMGLYLINNPNSSYSATSNILTIQGIDLMAKMNGQRNGNLEGLPYIIKQDSDVREAVIATLKEFNFNQYIVSEYPIKTPYEIRIEVGGNGYDIISEIINILPNYQAYFDVDGIFHFEEIPSGKDEQIFIDDDIWSRTLIDYTKSTDFTSVKNVIEVFGKTHDISNYGGDAKLNGNTYEINVSTIDRLRDYLKIGFISNNSNSNPYLKINNLTSYPIRNEDGSIPVLKGDGNYYVVKFREDKNWFEFMGNVQPHAIIKETNPESPFYVNGRMGEVRIVLSGGEYDNIYTDDLAMDRAKWELYTRCRLQDTITINCLPIYWADVNKVISITLPNKQGNEETNLYIIKNINTSFGITGVQSIQCMRYYPYYDERGII